jgi:type IV pilus assembly protein PilX
MTARHYTVVRQRGMALIVSLILLLVLTLLGLAAMQNTSLEERMAGNLRAENVAFQASESALRAGEIWVGAPALTVQPATSASTPATGQVWALDGPNPNTSTNQTWWLESDTDWWTTNGVPYAGTLRYTATESLAVQPRYVIEQAGFVRDSLVLGQQQDYSGRWFYQLTSRGVDAGGRGEGMLRSTFARRF